MSKVYRILIVDDEASNLEMMVYTFKKYHPEYFIYQALDGHKALEIAQKELPDLVIADWNMPEMSGIELTRLLKNNENTFYIPVIIATGVMLSPENLEKALSAGAFDYIRKPIGPIELLARTNSALKINENVKLSIDSKNQELVEKDLFSVTNIEFYKEIKKKIDQLKELCTDNNPKIRIIFNELETKINSRIDEDSWQKFNLSFHATHPSFLKNLVTEFPDLSPTELKLCTLIKLGIKTKEKATILSQTPESIKVARSRLRKKLKLKQSQNLESFLEKF